MGVWLVGCGAGWRRARWAGLLALLWLASSPASAHDATTMTPEEIRGRARQLILALDDAPRLAALAPAGKPLGELARALAALPEVRELVHLRPYSTEETLRRLAIEARAPRPERETLVAALVLSLEESDVRGALPGLLALGRAWPEGAPYVPPFTTQALLALCRDGGQQPVSYRFPRGELARALELGRKAARERTEELVASFASSDLSLRWVGSSGPNTLRATLERDAEVIELSLLAAFAPEPLLARFEHPEADLARDYELSALAYALELGEAKAAIPALAHFATGPDRGYLFAPLFATRALAVLSGQEDPNPAYHVYTPEQMRSLAERALARWPAKPGG
ncbi:MAG: hypothetical protein U0002_00080 [Thermoanaerobaculia bacterium]